MIESFKITSWDYKIRAKNLKCASSSTCSTIVIVRLGKHLLAFLTNLNIVNKT